MSDRDRLRTLETFIGTYEETLRTALGLYVSYMEGEAQRALDAYLAIKDDPEARARQDKTFITTRGLELTSQVIADAANRADQALSALADLTEDEDEELRQ